MVVPLVAAFEEFDARIQMTLDDRQAADVRAKIVCESLARHPFVDECLQVGSMVRSTAVRGISDVDILVVVDDAQQVSLRRPSEIIDLVGIALQDSNFSILRGKTAISLDFPNPPLVDVIPALRATIDEPESQAFWIGSMDEKAWQLYTPARQDQFVASKVRKLGPTFKSVVRMMKVWNQRHGKALKSSEVEELVGYTFSDVIPELPDAVCEFFESAIRIANGASLPQGDQLLVVSRSSSILIGELLQGRQIAIDARMLGQQGTVDQARAMLLWRGLFGDDFPADIR